MNYYTTILVCGRLHVLREVSPRNTGIPEANYMGTGKALCGVVDKGDTLEDWIKKYRK